MAFYFDVDLIRIPIRLSKMMQIRICNTDFAGSGNFQKNLNPSKNTVMLLEVKVKLLVP
jgi:hypothetical protein